MNLLESSECAPSAGAHLPADISYEPACFRTKVKQLHGVFDQVKRLVEVSCDILVCFQVVLARDEPEGVGFGRFQGGWEQSRFQKPLFLRGHGVLFTCTM